MATRLVLRLAGENARLGEVWVSDVACLLSGLVRVVGRTAAHLAGRAPGTSGPLPRSLARATRLRLSSISAGSLVVEVELPDVPADDPRLGEVAIGTALDVLAGSDVGFPDTVAAWSRLAKELSIGERYDTLTCALRSESPREAVLDAPARRRLEEHVQRRSTDELAGTLYEANFETRAGHLRTPHGEAVRVRFDDEQAHEVKDALREHPLLRSQITDTDETADLVAPESIEVAQPQRRALGPAVEDFWKRRSLAELAEAQGVETVVDVEALQDGSVSDEEAEAILTALGL